MKPGYAVTKKARKSSRYHNLHAETTHHHSYIPVSSKTMKPKLTLKSWLHALLHKTPTPQKGV